MGPKQASYCTAVGLCLAIFGLTFGIFWDTIFYKHLQEGLIIRTESPIYEIWHKPPMKTIVDFYLFNWTNPQHFRNPDIKPKFEELGPYRFIESSEKVNMVWHPENSTVSYRKKNLYHFLGNESRGSLDDVITTINSVAVAAATVSQHLSLAERTLAEFGMMVYPRDLTIERTVDELLFTGYRDTLLSVLNSLPVSPFSMPFDKYGYSYGRNNSASYFGDFNVYTGLRDFQNIGRIHTWNKNSHSQFYSQKCSKILGSAGEYLGPYLKPEGLIRVFAREYCRDMPLEFDSVTNMNGVKGFKYIGGLRAIDNGTLYAENACLCNGECIPSGVMNISTCWFNSPVFASYPHFYKADPYYLNQVDGLDPEKEKHEFSYTIEPKTSIGLDLVARSQMNIFVQPIKRSRMFHDARKIMFPLFWVEVRTRLTPDILDYFKSVSKAVFYGQLIAGILCTCGFLMALSYSITYRLRYKLVKNLENQDFEQVTHSDKATTKSNFQQISSIETNSNGEIKRIGSQPLLSR